MSLKPCRECGQGVSTDAMKCPHCGADWPHMSKNARGCAAGCTLLIVGSVVLLAIIGAIADGC